MATFDASTSDDLIDMSTASFVEVGSYVTQTATVLQYLATDGTTLITLTGNFTYSLGVPTSGAVSQIDFNISNDADTDITATYAPSEFPDVLDLISNANSFWESALGNSDTILPSTTPAPGFVIRTYLGDFLTTDTLDVLVGGNDTLNYGGGGGSFHYYADAQRNQGTLTGGVDTVNFQAVQASGQLYLDVQFNSALATSLVGGDDVVTTTAPATIDLFGASIWVIGDAWNNASILNGGNDNIEVRHSVNARVWGDTRETSRGTMNGGNDTIRGADYGNDQLFGDTENLNGTVMFTGGNDTIYGGAGNDQIYGDYENHIGGTIVSGGDDFLYGESGNDSIYGNEGNDTIDGGADDDIMDGGAGADTVTYASASAGVTVNFAFQGTQRDTFGAGLDTLSNFENLTGSNHADNLTGDGNANVVNGGDGNDVIRGGAGADTLNGGDDDDIIFFDAGDTSVDGGAGYDRLFAETGSLALNINLATSNLEFAQGGNWEDMFDASNVGEAVKLWGHGRDDMLTGSVFADYINGGAGNDTMYGNDGADILDGSVGADEFYAGVGDDILYVDADDTVIKGGADYDRIYVRGYSAGVNINIAAGDIEYASGNTQNDTFNAAGANWSVKLLGQGGNDTLTGGNVADQLYGSTGNDIIFGNGGADIISGGTGVDQINGGAGDDIIFIDADDTLVDAGDDYDRVYVDPTSAGVNLNLTTAHVEFAYGASGNDVFNANSAITAVKLQGRGGDDTLTGGGLADQIYGGTGADTITGNAGNDFLSGGGVDGAIDTFFFASGWGNDTLSDFQNGEDLLDVSALGTNFAGLTITALGVNHTVVSFGGDSITLLGMQLADVDASDFVFV